MSALKPYLGFVPALLVAVPCGIAAIRQGLFYKGCMDGFGFVMVGIFAFILGGLLNVGFLGYVAWSGSNYFTYSTNRQRLIAWIGLGIAGLLLCVQLAVILYIWILKHHTV